MTEEIIQSISERYIELYGASLAYFRTKGKRLFDIMRPASQTALLKKDGLGMSMFPMLPYAFRIKDGEFTYWGIKRLVPQNHPNFTDPIHGDGWRSEWQIVSKDKKNLGANCRIRP